jgi:drug/metabolite transporter (DMT)-like permease
MGAKTLAAWSAVYLVWGSTYLAIKVAVAALPPLFAAGVRFLIAGLLLYGWARLRHAAPPTREHWPRVWLLAAMMFLVCYSSLFWAEKTIPSGAASVLVATLPAWVLLFEISILKTQRATPALLVALAVGLAGVVLLSGGLRTNTGSIAWMPCAAILICEVSWAAGSVLSKRMALPPSHSINAGAQMLCGGILLLTCSALLGEWRALRPPPLSAIFAMLYLIFAGSLVAYSSYVWLLGRMSPTRLASYAYVNPVVALALGYQVGGETLSPTAMAGCILVLVSVILILSRKSETKPAARMQTAAGLMKSGAN